MVHAHDIAPRLFARTPIVVAALALGCGADEGTTEPTTGCVCDWQGASSSDSTGAGDCIEVRTALGLLPSDRKWAALGAVIDFPIHPFWADDTGLHLAYSAFAENPSDPQKPQAFIVVSSFPPAGGLPFQQAVYDVFPAGLDPYLSGHLDDFALSPTGEIAIAFRYRTSLSSDPTEGILLGQLGQPSTQKIWTPSWPSTQLSLWELAWDGEAFAAHFSAADESGIRLVRLAPGGTVLSGPEVAGFVSVLPDAFGVATDSSTGRTAFVTQSNPGLFLSGHERDGTPLFPSETYLGKNILAKGGENGGASAWPTVAVDADDILLAWAEGTDTNHVQRLRALEPAAGAITLSPPEGGLRQRALLHVDDGWWMFGRVYAHVDAFEVRNDTLENQRVLVSHSFESCWRNKSCPAHFSGMDARKLHAVRWQDKVWFGFYDLSDGYISADPSHRDPLIAYRIVNARSTCPYRSLYDEHHPDEGGEEQ